MQKLALILLLLVFYNNILYVTKYFIIIKFYCYLALHNYMHGYTKGITPSITLLRAQQTLSIQFSITLPFWVLCETNSFCKTPVADRI